jgi:hypothetical protein
LVASASLGDKKTITDQKTGLQSIVSVASQVQKNAENLLPNTDTTGTPDDATTTT